MSRTILLERKSQTALIPSITVQRLHTWLHSPTHELDHELDHVNHRHARSGEVHKMTEGARDEFFLRHSFVETLTMCVNDVPGPAT